MRVIFGIILGVALTVGAAYISDNSAYRPPATTGSGSAADHRQMVNWDVVSDRMRIASERIRAAWTRLSHKLES